jgi:hypothetical protein
MRRNAAYSIAKSTEQHVLYSWTSSMFYESANMVELGFDVTKVTEYFVSL